MPSSSRSSALVTESPLTLDRAARAAASKSEAALDAELVRRFNAGDDAAFIEIMNRYQRKIFTIVLGLLRNRADAEEITQDTFIRAHRGLSRFRGDSSLATWLHRIAVNLARNRYWYFFRRRRTPRSRSTARSATTRTPRSPSSSRPRRPIRRAKRPPVNSRR